MFYSKSDHIIKLYENMLIYTQVQNTRTFLKLRKSVKLVRRTTDAGCPDLCTCKEKDKPTEHTVVQGQSNTDPVS